ncbi:transposase, partial [Lasius niger]
MTKNIILDVIAVLYRNGYTVVALTCDLGTTNQAILKELEIDSVAEKTAYGIYLKKQNTILNKVTNVVKNMRVDVTSKNADIKYIMTNRLNQDMGASYDNPTSLQFRYRLRWYVLGKHSSDVFTTGSNTCMQDSSDEMCLTSDIDFGDEEKEEEREENKEENADDYDEAELILKNMQYDANNNIHSNRDFDKDYLYEYMKFEDENLENDDP